MQRALIVALLVSGCSGGTSNADRGPSTVVDAGPPDAGGAVDAAIPDAASSGAPCAFNRECPETERCECTEEDGCACRVGPRGTGVNGVDTCGSGNDCASSLCVEGHGASWCSDECDDEGDCAAALPVCADIALVGRICIRDPGGG